MDVGIHTARYVPGHGYGLPGASCCPTGGHQARPDRSQRQAHKIIQTYIFRGGRAEEGGRPG